MIVSPWQAGNVRPFHRNVSGASRSMTSPGCGPRRDAVTVPPHWQVAPP
jgi:hypothetical protein